MKIVKIKVLHPDASIPKYGSVGAACFDLMAISSKVVEEAGFGYIEYDFGLAFEIPEGYVGLIYPRSSISKTGMILSNSVGVVDSDYRGSVTARFKYIKDTVIYNPGERVAQMMIVPVNQVTFEVVKELSNTERNEGSYGSTGA